MKIGYRANNYIESFHHSLNMNLEVYHPKVFIFT
jgi:hypothetical protein